MTMSWNGNTGCPARRSRAQAVNSGMSGPTTLVMRSTATFPPRASRPSSASALCRPYTPRGERGASAAQNGCSPSNTRLVEGKSTNAPRSRSRCARARVFWTLILRVPSGS